MWKFQVDTVIQILREINFVECTSSKIAVFAIIGALDFVHLVNFNLEKVQKFTENQNSKPLNMSKMADFWTLCSLTLISRKI